MKVFCIGFGKTGTTTLERVLADFGFRMGDQEAAELLIHDYARGNWGPIVTYCDSADAFQDVPFSLPYTWLVLHEHFPASRFILTTRDLDEWYASLVNHHATSFGDGVNPPTAADLQRALYRGKYRGLVYDTVKAVWKNPDDDLYNKDSMTACVRRHNEDVRYFFRDKPNFIEIAVDEDADYARLAGFLDRETSDAAFPHLNRRR